MSRHRLSLAERAQKMYRGRPFKRYCPETGERVNRDGSPLDPLEGAHYEEGPHAPGLYPLNYTCHPPIKEN